MGGILEFLAFGEIIKKSGFEVWTRKKKKLRGAKNLIVISLIILQKMTFLVKNGFEVWEEI